MSDSKSTEMVSIPKHIVARISAYYKMGGFMGKNMPILVMNALDDMTHYDYGSSRDLPSDMRKKVSQVGKNQKKRGTYE